jgi:hypothetical protein
MDVINIFSKFHNIRGTPSHILRRRLRITALVTTLWLHDRVWISGGSKHFFSSPPRSKTALGPTQPSIQLVREFSPGEYSSPNVKLTISV